MQIELPNDDLIKKEQELAEGEVLPKNRLQVQIRLAKLLFDRDFHDHTKVDTLENRNDIMLHWSEGGNKSYSAYFRRLEQSLWFKNHPVLNGDIFKLSLEDLEDYILFEKSNDSSQDAQDYII